MIDWGAAARVAGTGFLTVFSVLGLLALTLRGLALLLQTLESRKGKE